MSDNGCMTSSDIEWGWLGDTQWHWNGDSWNAGEGSRRMRPSSRKRTPVAICRLWPTSWSGIYQLDQVILDILFIWRYWPHCLKERGKVVCRPLENICSCRREENKGGDSVFPVPRKFPGLLLKSWRAHRAQFEWLDPPCLEMAAVFLSMCHTAIQLRRVMEDGHSSVNIIHGRFVWTVNYIMIISTLCQTPGD